MMEHSVSIHSPGETDPEPDCIHSQLHAHDVHDTALDSIFEHLSVPSACVLRRYASKTETSFLGIRSLELFLLIQSTIIPESANGGIVT